MQVNPVVAGVIIVLAIAILGFVMWRRAEPPAYTGGPIDMGAAMRQGAQGPPGGAGR
jgi:hypothetical protein